MIKFKCPECGGDRAESVEINAVVRSPISVLEPEGNLEYEEAIIDDAEHEHFGCLTCNWIAKDADGNMITENDEFVQWCLDNCPQEDEDEVS